MQHRKGEGDDILQKRNGISMARYMVPVTFLVSTKDIITQLFQSVVRLHVVSPTYGSKNDADKKISQMRKS